MMKAKKIWVEKPWTLSLKEEAFEINILKDTEIVVKTLYSHLSAGTEMACISGIEDWFKIPNVPGYTAVGEVVKVGASIDKIKAGDVVYTYGPHAEYFKLDLTDRWHGVCVKLPDGLAPDIASFTHMAGIAFTSIRVSNIEVGDYVAVSGLGAIGNLAAQLAQIQGGFVIATDMNQNRIELAKKCGVEQTINIKEQKLAVAIRNFTDSEKIATWIDASGVPQAIEDAMQYIKDMGEMILLGSPRAAYQSNLTGLLQYVHLLEKGSVTMKGALEFIYPTWQNEFNKHSIERSAEILMKLINNGKLIVDPLYSHKLKPDEAQSAYEGLRDKPGEYIGVVFDWT
jgi:2-desacetyl-2-hydroxyethyl bacteriochlorophyllide A dehydrogenase